MNYYSSTFTVYGDGDDIRIYLTEDGLLLIRIYERYDKLKLEATLWKEKAAQ